MGGWLIPCPADIRFFGLFGAVPETLCFSRWGLWLGACDLRAFFPVIRGAAKGNRVNRFHQLFVGLPRLLRHVVHAGKSLPVKDDWLCCNFAHLLAPWNWSWEGAWRVLPVPLAPFGFSIPGCRPKNVREGGQDLGFTLLLAVEWVRLRRSVPRYESVESGGDCPRA